MLVISHGLWKRRYGASRDTIGRRLTLGGGPFTIVGVMPSGPDYPSGVEVWRTIRSVPAGGVFGDAARYEIDLIARLRPGVTIDQAASELAAMTKRLESDARPDHPRGLVPVVRSFENAVVGDIRSAILSLFGAVALVLFIAAANVANLLLLRGEVRSREIAMRAVLGAARGRIVSLLFAETLLLTTAAGAVAFVASWWSLELILTMIPQGLPKVDAIRIDGRVLAFTMGVALLTAMAACVVPGRASARRDLLAQLRNQYRGSRVLGRRALVAAQVALAVMIVAGAGLVVRSLLKLQATDLGLTPDRLVFLDLVPSPSSRTRHITRVFWMTLSRGSSRRRASRPHASQCAAVLWPRRVGRAEVHCRADKTQTQRLRIPHSTSNRFTPTTSKRSRFASCAVDRSRMRIKRRAERRDCQRGCGRADLAGEDPVGKRLKMGGPDSIDPWRTVVGVAEPTRYRELATARATLYLPAKQFLNIARMFAVRGTASLDLVASVAREAGALDPEVRVIRVAPFTQFLDVPLARPRFNAWLVGTFAIAALFMATVGLYAVIGAYVRQRDREIGIRVALGATTANVRNLVLIEAVRLAGSGAAAGFVSALVTTRLMRGMLFQVDPLDLPTLAGAALLLIAASLLAAYVPSRRAIRINPAALVRSQ